jgi:hypothetical protein
VLKSKLYLLVACLSILALLVTACAQPVPPEKPEGDGTIIIYVTDAPPDEEVTSIMVTLSEVQVYKASTEQESQSQDDEGEWITIDIIGNATFDLLQIKGIEQFLGSAELEATEYTQVRLVVDAIQVKVGSGELTDAALPSRELKIAQPFNVIAGETTALVLDFEADEMLNLSRTIEAPTLADTEKVTVTPVVKLIVRQEKQ